jgi:PAS domain-containing protein
MSHDTLAFEVLSTQQPVAPRERVATIPELHPRLSEQLAQARLAGSGTLELSQLLPLINDYYEQLDDERRGIVRSMQLIADEARSFGDGLAGSDAGHLQVILDHIKDVVITVAVDGTIKIFNPTGERVFG